MPASSEMGTVAMTGGSAARVSRTSAESERFAPGSILAQRYRIGGRIGRGGMGEVYRAYDLILEQDVALKFLPPSLTNNPAALDRFRNEVRLARQVSHPNVCRVYDIGEIEDAPFLTMEYVDGEDLASLLRRIGRLPADKALDIARRLCAGLSAAHEKGVLHRDLKPANIMIDGRGGVLITDFGLAAVTGTVDESAVRQGTPAYQAPEQLAGHEVTVRSDLYALGLVLYEVFTGKRAFEAGSMEELARMQRESTPKSVTDLVKDADPAIERAILRCLAADPQRRPSSARMVAASLPGADPLAAALAAGETPSPEMVAQAGEHEGLRPAIAIGLLAVVVFGLVGIAAIDERSQFPERSPFERSPEALTQTARDMLRQFGYNERPADFAIGYLPSTAYLRYAQTHFPPNRIWAQLAAARPAPLTLWYRQSPLPMDPKIDRWVSMDNPGFFIPGMARLRLDMEGRLVALEARPMERSSGAAAPPDWKALFDAASLDIATFRPATPEWAPSMAFDASAAWTGSFPGAAEIPIRIEAASWRGRPVSFRIVEPWTLAATDARPNSSQFAAIFWVTVPYFVFFPAGILLARRNLRLNRGDSRGAIRLVSTAFLILIAADAASIHHFWGPSLPGRMLFIGSLDFAISVFLGAAYLAIEPYVRRRCPGVLISWSRLLQVGPRDPLVGAHMLTGAAAAVIAGLILTSGNVVRTEYAHQVGQYFDMGNFVCGPRYFLGGFLGVTWSALFNAMVAVFFFFLMRLWLSRDWMAGLAVIAILVTVEATAASAPAIDVPVVIAAHLIGLFVLLRCGLCGVVSMMIVDFWLGTLSPLTLDASRWYFGYVLTELLVIAGLAAWACKISLGGRSLLKDDALG